MQPKALSKFEEKLIVSCDRYNTIFPGNSR